MPLRLSDERGAGTLVGDVHVTFSQLPVQAWSGLSNPEKRKLGITKGAGVSVVRAGREIDYGWFFMGKKRRENYDDWWRCEIRFEPELDEAFGITHTKQQIRPSPALRAALSRNVETIGRSLNTRVRRAHQAAKNRARVAPVEARVEAVEARMPQLPEVEAISREERRLLRRLTNLYPELALPSQRDGVLEYRLVEDELEGNSICEVLRVPGRVLAVLNTAHPFYQRIYAPMVEDEGAAAQREALDLMILALARAEVAEVGAQRAPLRALRERWSDALAELLKG